jgi:hypothetical protein
MSHMYRKYGNFSHAPTIGILYLVCGPMLCTAVRGLPFSPQMKFMYQIYLFFTPLHCHPAKCNPDHITVLCHNWPLVDQSPTPYIELSDWTTNCSVILPFGIMGWGIPDMRYYWQILVCVDAASNTLSIGSAMAKRRTIGYCAKSLKAPRPSTLGWHRRCRELF